MFIINLVILAILWYKCYIKYVQVKKLIKPIEANRYRIAFDLEHIGSHIVRNQVTQKGFALFDNNRVLASTSIGPIRIDEHRVWDPSTLAFWKSQPGMQSLLNDLITNHNTIFMQQALQQLEQWIDIQSRNYNFRTWKLPENQGKCSWLTDTNAADITLLNSTIMIPLGNSTLQLEIDSKKQMPPLQLQFGKQEHNFYQDVEVIKALEAECMGAGYTWKQLTAHKTFPSNKNAHNAEADAIFIAECYIWLTKFLAEHRQKQLREIRLYFLCALFVLFI